MPHLDLGDLQLHWREDGDPEGMPVVFAHALGLDLTLWDALIERMPKGLRLIRYDLRGHGASGCPPGPYAMGALIRDAERLLDHLGVKDCVFVGVSLGGMIAQGLAVKRLDLVRGLVLSNTAVKLGTPEVWARRIADTERLGLEGMAETVLERWFPKRIRRGLDLAPLRARLTSTPLAGYLGCCRAIAGTDFYTPTAGLRLPVLVIAGSEDGSTPPDLVRETAELIPGAEFQLIRGAGHLPMVDATAVYADRIADFITRTGQAARVEVVEAEVSTPHRHDEACGCESGGCDDSAACGCGAEGHSHDHPCGQDAAGHPPHSHHHGRGCCG